MCKSIKIKNTMAILVESNWFNTTWSSNWLTIVFVTILLILLALIIAFFFKKIAQVNLETAILSVIPGALSQMLVMAEENKKANILVVSLTQTSRVIFVVILVPLISYFFQDNHHEMNHTTMEVPTLSDFKYMANNHLILNGGNHLYRNVKN